MDDAAAYRRWMIVAAGGHEALIARVADFLETHQGAPRRKRSPPAANRSGLFAAYFGVMQRGNARASTRGNCNSITGHSKSMS